MLEVKAFLFTTASLLIGLLIFLYCADRRLNALVGKRLVLATVVAQAAAFLSPNIIVYNLIPAIVLLACCTQRRMIAPIYLFLMATLPLPAVPIQAGGVYILLYDVSISLAIAGLIAMIIRSKGRFSRSIIWDVPVVCLFLLFVIANARSTSATNILRVTLEQASLFLTPYFVISRSIRSFDDIRDALYGMAASVAALSTLAVYEALRTWPLYRLVSERYGVFLGGGASVKIRAGFLRSSGPYVEPTSFGFYLVLGLLAAIGCRHLFASKRKQSIVITVMSIGVLVPQSRGAWIGLAAGMILMHLYDRRFTALAKKAIVAVGALALIFVAGQVDQRIASAAGLNAEGQGTVEYRSNLLERGIDTVKIHPVFGDTLQNVRFAMRDMMQGEGIVDFVNTYLLVALLSGLVGLAIFAAMLSWTLMNVWQAKYSFAPRFLPEFLRRSSASVIFAMLGSSVLMISFTSMTGRTTTQVIVCIALASAVLNNLRGARRELRQAIIGSKSNAEAVA